MAKLVFDEMYGELTFAQRSAYRKFNVSPSDHDNLVGVFGAENHSAITNAVKKYSPNGMFSFWEMRKEYSGL